MESPTAQYSGSAGIPAGPEYVVRAHAAIPALTAEVARQFPGAQVGEVLGVGSTGPVLAAVLPGRGGVAVKGAVMPELTPEQRRAQILGEAVKLARVAGPHTLALRASLPDAAVPFLVTELMAVGSVTDLLAPAPDGMAAAEAVGLLLGLASALWSCHAAGLVHLDIKPRNVGVSAEGRATLMDFGLARSHRNARVHKLPAGTMPYTAPELVQVVGDVGPPTDVWGFGLFAHILLTGSYPGRRPASWGDLFRRGPVVPPPLGQVRPDVPAPVRAVLERALTIEPAGRQSDGEALFEELADAAERGFGARWQAGCRYRFEPPG